MSMETIELRGKYTSARFEIPCQVMIDLRQDYRIKLGAPYGVTLEGFSRWMSEQLSEEFGAEVTFHGDWVLRHGEQA
jgi:hypothetical protein